MFRVKPDPSSGSDNLYLTEITYNGLDVLVMRVVGNVIICNFSQVQVTTP
jgi:hypothetical protein